jgi:hypothetical protein
MGRCLMAARAKPVTGVIVELMQGQAGAFAERMQGRHLYVLGYFGERIQKFGKRTLP